MWRRVEVEEGKGKSGVEKRRRGVEEGSTD